MSSLNYFSLSGTPKNVQLPNIPQDAYTVTTQLDDSIVKDCLFIQVGWYKKPFTSSGLIKHDSDEILVFAGNDLENPEELNAEIEIQLENDILSVTKTSVVYVPAGTAHGNIKIKNIDKPVFYYVCHMNTGTYESEEATPKQPTGTFANQVVEGYVPVDGKMPDAPKGFLTPLLLLNSQKIYGAPYMETVWFKTNNKTSPAPHEHDFDELVAFIGSNPDNPSALGAKISLDIGGEAVTVTESCVAYIPRDLIHCPLLVPELNTPLYHFSLGNGGDYIRSGNRGTSNSYIPE